MKFFKNSLIIMSFLIIGGLVGTAPVAHAQFFGFSVDGAIAYSAADEGISGGSFGIIHPIPFVPNIGGMGFFFERRDSGSEDFTLATKVKASSVNLFYNIPVPIFTLSAGIGGGTLETSTDIIGGSGNIETIDVTTPIGEGFIRVGLPFFNVIDFHLGYHLLSVPEVELTMDSDTDVEGVKEKVNFSGGLTTVGFQIAL